MVRRTSIQMQKKIFKFKRKKQLLIEKRKEDEAIFLERNRNKVPLAYNHFLVRTIPIRFQNG